MEKELITSLTRNFESSVNKTEGGIDFWLARDLQLLLGYTEWRNFLLTVEKAIAACELSGQKLSDHFVDVNKTIKMPKGAKKEVPDIMLTRYACYLIAQNGDSRKEPIAFAQTYFAVQTRRMEIIEQRLMESERLSARKKLSETEKELSSVIFQHTGSDKHFGLIRSKGDKAFFTYSTQEMKRKWKIQKSRALADFAPTIILKAKDFATEITIFKAREKDMKSEQEISREHVSNHTSVRNTLLERGIHPEFLPPEVDVKRVERRLISEKKKTLLNSERLRS